MAARSVLMLLVWHADANGRAWLGIQAIANKTGAGNLRTVRHALDTLVRSGWLHSKPQTWATLTAEQTAAGRPTPRRGDVGQAPNLYVVLDGNGNSVTPEKPGPLMELPRLGLARVSSLVSNVQPLLDSPGQNDQRGPRHNDHGEPGADLPADPDPKGSKSRIESAERVERAEKPTHVFSNVRPDSPDWLPAWNVIVETHANKTKTVYGLAPLPPDLKREHQQALAECLDGAAIDVRAQLRERTGIERGLDDVQRDLATRVMQLYFKRDNEHLRRVKHALRDLPREFHARITEARHLLLRESHEATPPKRVQLEPLPHVEVPDKPHEVVKPQPIETAAQAVPAQVITAREARRLLETLKATATREEPSKQAATEHKLPTRPKLDDPPTCRVHHEQPGRDKPEVQDKLHAVARAGAPRWGAVGPRPAMVARTSSGPVDEIPDEPAARQPPPLLEVRL